jgi:hypothetical protein
VPARGYHCPVVPLPFSDIGEPFELTSKNTTVFEKLKDYARGSRGLAHRPPLVVVAAAFVPLHVASDAECLPTASVRALERLLSRVGVAMDAERAGPREGFAAGLADVAVLGLRERRRRGRRDVVMVLPRVGSRRRCQ